MEAGSVATDGGSSMEAYMKERLPQPVNGEAGTGAQGKDEPAASPQKFAFLKLPPELQHDVVDYLGRSDLLRLQRASRECHDLASRNIWRGLDFFLEGRLQYSLATGPACRLMQAFHTLSCSERNYAQYIKHFGLLGHPSNPIPTTYLQVFKIRYAAGSTAQQSLNINILMMLQRAKSLESFTLEAPFELSEAVWCELARKKTLLFLNVALNGRLPYLPDPRVIDPLAADINVAPAQPGISYRHVESCSNLEELSLLHLSELDHLEQIAACIRSSSASLKFLQLSFSDQLFEKAKKPSGHSSQHHNPGLPPPHPIDIDDDESYMSFDDADPPVDPGAAQAETESIRKNKAEHENALARILSIDSDKIERMVEKALKKVADGDAASSQLDESDAEKLPDLIKKIFKGDKMDADELTVVDRLQSRIQSLRAAKKAKTSSKSPSKPSKPKPKPKKYHPPPGSSQAKDIWHYFSSSSSSVLPPPPTHHSNIYGEFDSPSLPLPVSLSHQPKPPGIPNLLEGSSAPDYTLPPLVSSYAPDYLHTSPWPVAKNGINAHHKKLAHQMKLAPKAMLVPPPAASSSSASELISATSASTESLPLNDSLKDGTTYEDMEIDMENPDEISGESGDDQESADEDTTAPRQSSAGKGKGKAKEAGFNRNPSPSKRSLSQSNRNGSTQRGGDVKSVEDMSPDEIVKDWIRKTDGLAIENFQMYLIPLKASVLGRALQLRCLTEVVLLSVGGQVPFWQLLDRAQSHTPLALKRIHTDDVSKVFLEAVSRMNSLTKLILRRRCKKDKFSTTTKNPARIDEIRKQAIQPHLHSLEILAIRNDNDASWCLTEELVGLLCARAVKLEQFAFQAGSTRYNDLMRLSRSPSVFPRLRSLFLISTGMDRSGVLAMGTSLVPPPPPPPVVLSHSGQPGPNGEPFDLMHSNVCNDNYRGCFQMTKDWAAARKEAGDQNLRYIAVHSACARISGPKKSSHVAKEIPAWLKDEYDSRHAAGDTDVKPFEQWAAENGPKGLEASQYSFKYVRGILPPGEIFSAEVVYAKLG